MIRVYDKYPSERITVERATPVGDYLRTLARWADGHHDHAVVEALDLAVGAFTSPYTDEVSTLVLSDIGAALCKVQAGE